jgi:glycosyltransferase involved in cell wall biosynthesis
MLTITIPTYTITDELADMAVRCVSSYRNECDRIIVCEDGGHFNSKLMALADTYIYNWHNVGFTANVNRGWRQSDDEFTAIVSSDTYLVSGDLKDLCIKGKVTSPMIENQSIDGLAGSFFVVHKSCPKYLIETMKTYYSDEEYKERTKDLFVKVPSVVIHHHQAQSVKAAGIEGNMSADKEAYDALPK